MRALLIAGIFALYFARAYRGGPASNVQGLTSEYYGLLTDAFLAGQTSLLVKPSPELLALPDPRDPVANRNYRLHDASLYKGKYYLYFGPVPALVLFLPFKVLTGWHLPTRIALALFCMGGFACSCALFFLLANREQWVFPIWLEAAIILSLGISSPVFFLLRRPSFYEIAVGGAYCFLMGGFLLTARSLGGQLPRTIELALAGLCFGLAAGCRPTHAMIAVLMAALLWFGIRRHQSRFVAFAIPIVLCGGLLAWYNYVRFQNPFETGMRYDLPATLDTQGYAHFGLRNVVPGIFYFVCAPPSFGGGKFPFIHSIARGFPFWRVPDKFFAEPISGVLCTAPLALLGFCAPLALWRRRLKHLVRLGSTRLTIHALYSVAIATLILLVFTGWVCARYLVDFAPPLVLISCCLLAAIWQRVSELPLKKRILLTCTVAGTTVYSVIVNFGISVRIVR